MASVRINISLPEELLDELVRVVEPRKRSQFISDAVKSSLRDVRDRGLAAEYQEASEEMRRINRELEGAIGDGLD